MHHKRSLFGVLLLLSPSLYAQSNTVIATINTGVNPAGIAISPNNRTAFVANNNDFGISDQNTVSVLNLQNNTAAQTISDPSFDQPFTITLNKSGSLAFVTNSNGSTISVIDTRTNQVTNVIDGFDGPSGMVITPNGKIAYVINYGSGSGSGRGDTVSMVNLQTNMIAGDPITIGQAPSAIAISPDGKFVYVTNYVDGDTGTGTLSVIRTSDNTVVSTITGFSGPFAIAVTPNGKQAFVTNFGSNNFDPIGNTVSVVDLSSRMITKNITVGLQPSGIAITPNGDFALVTNFNTFDVMQNANTSDLVGGQGTVNIIDTHSKKVLPTTIVVGQSPDAIAISSNGKFAYVTNYTSNTVSVIQLKK